MTFEPCIPILRIFDYEKAQEFYIEFLEFEINWVHQFEPDFPRYIQISKGNCIIHLSEHHGDVSPGSSIRIQSDDVLTFTELLRSKKYKYSSPGTEEMPWGNIESSIHDPFGNKLTFYTAR